MRAACARKAGCNYFIFGVGKKAGSCWQEFTSGDECPEGWEADDFDFYELDAPPSPPDGATLIPADEVKRREAGAFVLGVSVGLALTVLLVWVKRAAPWLREVRPSPITQMPITATDSEVDTGQRLLAARPGPSSEAKSWVASDAPL